LHPECNCEDAITSFLLEIEPDFSTSECNCIKNESGVSNIHLMTESDESENVDDITDEAVKNIFHVALVTGKGTIHLMLTSER
jgi:hypothetical protein